MLRRQTYTATISSDAPRTGVEPAAITLISVVEIRLIDAIPEQADTAYSLRRTRPYQSR